MIIKNDYWQNESYSGYALNLSKEQVEEIIRNQKDYNGYFEGLKLA
jgi:hypothetical protein